MTKCYAGYVDCHLHRPFWFWNGKRWVRAFDKETG
jgi:hypothetical protein